MPGDRTQGELVRSYILKNVSRYPMEIGLRTADKFSISRPAVSKHLKRLVNQGELQATGKTKDREYSLVLLKEWRKTYSIEKGLSEDVIWADDISSMLSSLPDNVRSIWNHGFTKMFNNAIDHSEGSTISVSLRESSIETEIVINDDGIGIFRKIQADLKLLDERHALLELSKGKLTTDPEKHTGEGIFFTSKMFDQFDIVSGGVIFLHNVDLSSDWLFERTNPDSGTMVWMKLEHKTSRTASAVFNTFMSEEDASFSKTVVPVALAKYGDENLVSRSQAKRLMSKLDRFRIVLLDFEDVDTIGQAFADEIFRVFTSAHSDISLMETNANEAVRTVIQRAKNVSLDN